MVRAIVSGTGHCGTNSFRQWLSADPGGAHAAVMGCETKTILQQYARQNHSLLVEALRKASGSITEKYIVEHYMGWCLDAARAAWPEARIVWLIRSPFDCVRSLAIHDHDSRDMVGAAIRDTLGPEDFGLPDIDNRWEWCCWYYATINWLGLQFCLRDRNSMLVRIEEMNDHDKRMVVAERLDREADNDGFPTKVKGRDWSKMPKEKTMHHWPLMDAEIWNRINQILSLVYGREPEVSGGSI